jgi:nitrogen regulatory protein P-II 1
MKLITAILRPHKLDDVKAALSAAGVMGLTVSEVMGHGRQRGHTEVYRGTEYTTEFLPKVKLETIVDDGDLDRILGLVIEAAQTGKVGDGKIWVLDVPMVVRIRTDERGSDALA